jgi:hypothetical protein
MQCEILMAATGDVGTRNFLIDRYMKKILHRQKQHVNVS